MELFLTLYLPKKRGAARRKQDFASMALVQRLLPTTVLKHINCHDSIKTS